MIKGRQTRFSHKKQTESVGLTQKMTKAVGQRWIEDTSVKLSSLICPLTQSSGKSGNKAKLLLLKRAENI